jgi:hypothetical protein
MDLIFKPYEDNANTIRCTEKGHKKGYINTYQSEKLSVSPHDFKRIKGYLLGDDKTPHHGETQKDRIADKKHTKSGDSPFLGKGDKRPACTIAQEGEADNHGDEMVPLDDAE